MGERVQRIVIALGESALFESTAGDPLLARLVQHLQPLLSSGAEVVLTHGGLPQPWAESGVQLAPPSGDPRGLEALVAGSEGELGDALVSALRREFDERRPVAAVLTHVRVDARASGFGRPRRAVGPVLEERELDLLRRQGLTVAFDVGTKGFRVLMPQVEPQEVLDVVILRRLLESGVVVVAGGGGGIPVIREGRGWRRAEAVVDQDLTATLLADSIDADQLFLVTDVSNVFEGFGTPHEEPIGLISVDELHNLLAEGHFRPGSMAPKVEACVRFVSGPGRRAVICDAASIEGAMAGLAGTRVMWAAAASPGWSVEHHAV